LVISMATVWLPSRYFYPNYVTSLLNIEQDACNCICTQFCYALFSI